MPAAMEQPFMSKRRIFVAGHRGMVGSAIMRHLQALGDEVLTVSRDEVDLRDQSATHAWLKAKKPQSVIVAAAKVGGIHANSTQPAHFLYDNLAIEMNLIHGAHLAEIDRVVFLGSSCIYPKFAPQPIAEDSLLTGPLEPTNEWYAIAKIAGIKLCQAYRRQYNRRYISVMPCNLYGPNDNFDLMSSHVIPALMRKVHEAKLAGATSVSVWGTGTPLREFLHVDDLARGVIFCHDHYDGYDHINCGTGSEVTIRDLAQTICKVVGFGGALEFDTTKPDGTPRKVMDSRNILALGWSPSITLEKGLADTYQWFLANRA
jgi:GDP-L-fucose synthase